MICDIKKKNRTTQLSTSEWTFQSSTWVSNGTFWLSQRLEMLNITLAVMNLTLISPLTSRCAEKHYSTLSTWLYHAWASPSSLSSSSICHLTVVKRYSTNCMHDIVFAWYRPSRYLFAIALWKSPRKFKMIYGNTCNVIILPIFCYRTFLNTAFII